jgi:hypothetical protein
MLDFDGFFEMTYAMKTGHKILKFVHKGFLVRQVHWQQ